MPTTITIFNAVSEDRVEPLARALSGKTFMKLEVGFAPVGGSFDVLVTTTRPETSEEELRDMVMSVLVSAVLDMGSPAVLRALATGVDRLNDGDPDDRKAADEADARVLTNYGLVRERTAFIPKEGACSGYIRSGGSCLYAWEAGFDYGARPPSGWLYTVFGDTLPVATGTTIYADEACTVPLRTV